jgi:hypothetical protein
MANEQVKTTTRREQLASAGLRLPALTLRRLKDRGIFCVSTLSVVLQHSTQRYVIRAHESGGAVADLGAFCGFVTEEGKPLAWLQRVETIGVNGLHARVVATSLVRVHVVRVMHTYELLITKHSLPTFTNGRKPSLVNSIIFHGRQGTLELELWGKDAAFRGCICPLFYDRGGDPLKLPDGFEDAVGRAVAGVSCCGCEHSHLLVPPEIGGGVESANPSTAEPVTSGGSA